MRDGNNNIFVTDYNALNLPWKQYDPAPFAAQYVETRYDKNGKPVSVTNRRGFTTTTGYDALGRVETVTDPAPFASQNLITTYDKVGNVKTVKDKRNIISENLYDDLYRLTEQRRDNVRLVTNEYDDAGNKTATVDAENHRVEYAYNSRNLLEKTTFIDGVDNFYADQFYDGVGNVVSAFNEARQETVTTFDNENRKRTVTFAGETSENLYDAVGNLTTAYKPKRNSRVMSYDGLNRLETVGEGSLTTTYTYDANGNLRTEEDPRGNLVEFAYDALNRKTAHIQHKGSGNLTINYDLYDAEGNLKQTTDAKGQVFTYDYDELNRPVKSTFPAVTTPFLSIQEIVTGYDANNNVTSVTETKAQSGGGTVTDVTSNVWDHFDRLDNSTQRGVLLDYGYDNNGNRTSVVTANGSTTYTFDSRNRLETAVVGAETTTYSYTPVGQTDTVNYPNGTSATYTYWPANRVETVTHKAGETVISSFAYTYDDNGNRTRQIEVQGATTETTDYGYDSLDRMENFTLTSGADTTVTAYTFEGYNRKTENVTVNAVPTVSKTYSYDATNWLTELIDTTPAPPVTIAYQYDNNGNSILKTDSSKPGEDLVFDYDVANRMVQTRKGPTLLGQYDYNAQGLRVRHYGSERGDVDYFYDDGAVLEERLASGSLLAHYRYADRLLSLNAPSDGGVQYYHHDALGSTVNLTDSVGGTKVSYTLDPWGHIRNQSGTSVNRQVFTGQEHDGNTGLIYFGARYYDPDTARFINQDSYLGEPGTPPSLHRYLYAYSNPTVYIDLAGYMSATTDIDQAATRAAEEGNNLKLAGLVTAQAGYKLADVLTFGWISKHDESRDKYDRGEISLQEYAGDSLKAAGESGVYLGATIATGGVAGYATRGMSLTTQLVAAGAASGVGYQAADDALRGEISGVGTYAGAAGLGAAGGVAARGAVGMKNVLGEASIKEGMQILKAAAKDNAQAAARMTGEVANGAQEAGQKLMQKVKTAYQNSSLADETGAVGPGVRRLYLDRKFGRSGDLNRDINFRGIVDSVRRDAQQATENAFAQGLSSANGRLGSRSHTILESTISQNNQQIRGLGFELIAEQYRGPSISPGVPGPVVSRHAAGSKGLDVLIRENGNNIYGLDLKTGRGWSKNTLQEYEKRFGVSVEQIFTGGK